MGLNLAGGLAAVDGFFRAQEHQQDRDYLQKQRDYQRQIMQAGLDTLPDQTGADLARLRLSAATSTAGLDTLPAQTAADQAKLSLSTATSNAGLDTLPGQTANTLARQGLESGDLTFQAMQQPKTQQVAAATTDRAVADIPELETQRVATNADKFNERQMHAYQAFATSLNNNDKDGALQIANQWASTEALRGGTVGKKFIDIRPTGEGEARKYQLVADDNTTFDIPAATLKAAADRAKTGKYSMHQGKEGEVYTLNENTGAVEQRVARRADYGEGGTSGGAAVTSESMVDAIGQGKLAPPSGMALRNPKIVAMMERVTQKYPDYDATEYVSKTRAMRDFTTGRQGDAIRSFAVASEHLGQLGGLIDALDNGNLPLVNKLANTVAQQTGSEAPTNFDAAKGIVAKEVMKSIVAGGGGVEERQELSRLLDSAKTPKQLKGVVKTYQNLMSAQKAGLERQYELSTGRKDSATRFNYNGEHGAPTVPNPTTPAAGSDGWGELRVH